MDVFAESLLFSAAMLGRKEEILCLVLAAGLLVNLWS